MHSDRKSVHDSLEEEAQAARNIVCADKVEFSLQDVNGVTADLGCGDGAYLPFLRNRAEWLIGLDASRTRIRRAKATHQDLILADVVKLCFRDEVFDTAILIDVLEHVIYMDETIAEINRVLKQKGKLYIATPNKFVYRISRFASAKLLHHREPTITHYSEMTYREVKKLISKSFRITKVEGRLGSKWPRLLSWLKRFPSLAPNIMLLCEKRSSPS